MIRRDYCSINVANHDGTWLIRFVPKNYTHTWKGFANKLRLILHACIRLFVKFFSWCKPNMTWFSNVPFFCSLCCGRWLVLICCETKVLLVGWWLLVGADLVWEKNNIGWMQRTVWICSSSWNFPFSFRPVPFPRRWRLMWIWFVLSTAWLSLLLDVFCYYFFLFLLLTWIAIVVLPLFFNFMIYFYFSRAITILHLVLG